MNPSRTHPQRVAIVGAGMSGLACGRHLYDAGWDVRIYEKSRGLGGRIATRRTAGTSFDHGAQYFTVRDPRFARFVARWRHDGVVRPWDAKVVTLRGGDVVSSERDHERLVGVPGMSAVARYLGHDLPITTEARIECLEREAGAWTLVSECGAKATGFDAVVLSAPAPQTAALLMPVAPRLAARAEGVRFSSCIAAMMIFERPLELDFDAAFVDGSPLAWIARNTSKPGRSRHETWVLHAAPDWSDDHFDQDPGRVLEQLRESFASSLGRELPTPTESLSHRWRFAIPTNPLDEHFLFDPELGLGASGDWCGGPRVEGAFLSGLLLAERLSGRSVNESSTVRNQLG